MISTAPQKSLATVNRSQSLELYRTFQRVLEDSQTEAAHIDDMRFGLGQENHYFESFQSGTETIKNLSIRKDGDDSVRSMSFTTDDAHYHLSSSRDRSTGFRAALGTAIGTVGYFGLMAMPEALDLPFGWMFAKSQQLSEQGESTLELERQPFIGQTERASWSGDEYQLTHAER